MTNEQPVVYQGGNSQLFGVLHRPSPGRDLRHGVLFVPGEPDHLFGDHSMYVYGARQLACAGFHCLRFDFGGRGNSEAGDKFTPVGDCVKSVCFLESEADIDAVSCLAQCYGAWVALYCLAAATVNWQRLVMWSPTELADKRSMDIRRSSKYLKAAVVEFWGLYAEAKNQFASPRGTDVPEEKDLGQIPIENLVTKDHFRATVHALGIYPSGDPSSRECARDYEALCRFIGGISYEARMVEDSDHSYRSHDKVQEVVRMTVDWLSASSPAVRRASGIKTRRATRLDHCYD